MGGRKGWGKGKKGSHRPATQVSAILPEDEPAEITATPDPTRNVRPRVTPREPSVTGGSTATSTPASSAGVRPLREQLQRAEQRIRDFSATITRLDGAEQRANANAADRIASAEAKQAAAERRARARYEYV